jgi:acyl-CoA thioesterase
MSALAEALALTPVAEGIWRAFADPRFESRNGMFGGWTAALAIRAVLSTTGDAFRPSAITVNYVAKVDVGSTFIARARLVGSGRSLQHWHVELVTENGKQTLAQGMLVVAQRRPTDGHTQPTFPAPPPPESLGVFHPRFPAGERLDVRSVHGTPPFGRHDTSSLSWVRDLSGRRVDDTQLAYLSDCATPRSYFWRDEPGLSATMSMSVFIHATNDELAAVGDDFILSEVSGPRGADSTSSQQTRLWSRTGALLATSEQMCWFR